MSALLLAGCKGSSPAPDLPAASVGLRFLPPAAELAVRIDLARARAWPQFGTLATTVLREVQPLLDVATRECALDVVGETHTLVVARSGASYTDDVTILARGLPRERVTDCLRKLTGMHPGLEIRVEGDVVHALVDGKPFASGAFLPAGPGTSPEDVEMVLVARGGAGVEPAAWTQEVTRPTGAAPAWWAELDAAAPIAVRVATPERTVRASAQLGDPLIVRSTLAAPTVAAANDEVARVRAIVAFLTQARAGTGEVALAGTTITASFTARGPEIDALLATALPVLTTGASTASPGAPTAATDGADGAPTAGPPRTCAELAPAVAQYMNENLALAPAARRTTLATQMTTLVPALQKVFVERCEAEAWASPPIDCHVRNATALNRFEKCRELLTEPQRTALDEAVRAALAAS